MKSNGFVQAGAVNVPAVRKRIVCIVSAQLRNGYGEEQISYDRVGEEA